MSADIERIRQLHDAHEAAIVRRDEAAKAAHEATYQRFQHKVESARRDLMAAINSIGANDRHAEPRPLFGDEGD